MDNNGQQTREELGKLLDQYEVKAWDAMAHYRFAEAFMLIEYWSLLHRESGLKRENPFQEVAALARRKYGEKLREVR